MAKLFLYPFSWLYGLVVYLRNQFYDYNILKSKEFDIPVISIGNITVGGTGKTPHVEYLSALRLANCFLCSFGNSHSAQYYTVPTEKTQARKVPGTRYNTAIMIRSLTGTVTHCHPQWTEVQLGGFGLKVFTPPLSFPTGTTVTLHTYLAVRETALDLYGFCTTRELELFELLLSVPKIGPKSALQIVSGNDLDTLLTAITEQDVSLLKHGVGVSGKTGAAIVTQLHNKVTHLRPTTAVTPHSSVELDAIEALIGLGFSPDIAKARVRACTPTDDVTKLITAALQQPS